MITAVLDRMAGRLKQRKTTAREVVEQAARRIAGGETVDEAALEGAIVEAGLAIDDLQRLAEFYVARREKRQVLDALGAARKRLAAVDARIAAENAKHAEIVDAYKKRWIALREEADAATREVDAGRAARDWLLELANCPPSMQDDYRRLLDEEQAATVAVGDATRVVRELRERILSEKRSIESLTGATAQEIDPSLVPLNRRNGRVIANDEQIEEHRRTIKRLEGRLVEAESVLAAAEKQLAAATLALGNMRDRILKH